MKILIAGDFSPKNILSDTIVDGSYKNYYKEIRNITSTADLSIVNFETTLVNKDSRPIRKCGPNLSAPDQIVDAVKWLGFDMVTLANNHSLDFGSEGLQKTIETLKENNVAYVGAGCNLEGAQKYSIQVIDSKKVAVVNCCEEEFTIATDDDWGANPLRPADVFFQIQLAKREADFVIVITHAGHEHFQLPSLEMQKTFRLFIEAGADAVVNHHQHCFSGMEVYKDKPIVYGVGNFLFYSPIKAAGRCPWNEGYLCMLELSDAGIKSEVIPYLQNVDGLNFTILKDRREFDHEFNQLSRIITNKSSLKQHVIDYYRSDEKSRGYFNMLQPFYGRIYNALTTRGLIPRFIAKKKLINAYNFINCESHRTPLLYAYRERIKRLS